MNSSTISSSPIFISKSGTKFCVFFFTDSMEKKETKTPTYSPVSHPTSLPISLPTLNTTEYPYEVVEISNGGKYNGTTKKEHFIINVTSSVEITSGGGEDLFTILAHPFVNITITDFNQSSQVIDLKSFTNIFSMNDINITYGSAIINLPEEQKIRLLHLSPSDIKIDNFVFYSTYQSTAMPTRSEQNPTISPTILENDDNVDRSNELFTIMVSISCLFSMLCFSLGFYRFKNQIKKIFTSNNKVLAVDKGEVFFDVESAKVSNEQISNLEEINILGEVE